MGLGRSGWNIHAAAFAEHEGFDVVAVADPDADRRAEAHERFGCATHKAPEELLADDSIEVVVVATPSHTHVPLTVAALAAGRHVVVEKPMAQSASEVDTMVGAAEQSGQILSCFQNRRFDPDFLVVREVIESGRLGDLVLVRLAQHRFSRRADWQTLRKFGGGELSNTAPHLLDQCLQLMPAGPVEVFADLRRAVCPGDAEDHVKLSLRGKSGPVIDVESTTCVATPQQKWLIAGTTGGLTSDRDAVSVRWFDPSSLPELEPDEGAVPGRKYGTGETIDWQTERIEIPKDNRSAALMFYDRFYETVRNGADVYITPESVRRQIDIIERARQQTGFH